MAATYRFSLAPCLLNNAVSLTELHNVSVSQGANRDIVTPGGAVDTGAVILASGMPGFTFATHDLSSLLTGINTDSGLACTAASTLYFQKRDGGGTFTGSGTHEKIVAATGYVHTVGITASQGSAAEASARFYSYSSDGLTEPHIATGSVSLNASAAFVSRFYLGPAFVGATQIRGVQSVSYDTGIDYRLTPEDGAVWPTNGAVYMRRPTISITFNNVSSARALIAGLSINVGTAVVKFFLRKGASAGTRTADATTVHLSFAITAAFGLDQISVSNNEDASCTLTANCIGSPTIGNGVAIS